MMRQLASALAVATVVSAAPALAAPMKTAETRERPNIVVVLTDDQRWDTLAAMPTVRRELVGRGVTFANAFAVSPLCCPSRASLLTGRYPHSTGVYDNRPPHGGADSFDDSSTLATWLAGAGYRTAYVGKYLNGYDGRRVPPGWHRWVANTGGFFDYPLTIDGLRVSLWYDDADYSTDVFTREALAFAAESRDPFFLVYAPYAPHAPATPAPRHAHAYADLSPRRPPSHDEPDVSDKPRWLRDRPRLTAAEERETDELRRSQLASLLAIDEGVGEILETLSAAGRLERTIVVFTSDNGLLLGEHRLANAKAAPFEESIRVPLVLRYDALVARTRTERRLVANVDVAPTLAELAGTRAPHAEGESLVPLLAPAASVLPPWRDAVLVEHRRGRAGGAGEVPTYCAVRTARFKYIAYVTGEEELYDLREDRNELRNRVDDPALRERVLALRSQLRELCDPPPPGFDPGGLCTHVAGAAGAAHGTSRADTLCGSPASDVLRARADGDVVQAGAGDDVVYGDGGADRIVGGPGSDRLNGGAGDDVVLARDGEPDRITCGRGRDVVVSDRGDVVARDCESRVRTAPPR